MSTELNLDIKECSDREATNSKLDSSKKKKCKCSKSFRNKFKKYKIRKDGYIDPDVVDVSKNFHMQLKIKSPIKLISSNNSNEVTVNCNIFAMGRNQATMKKVLFDSNINLKKENKQIVRHAIINLNKRELENTADEITLENKNTNAFEVMMSSRSRSIGSNSPGKEKPWHESNSEETLTKKNLKLKRSLILQKMAEAKGSSHNKELEEHKDAYIKHQMAKRKRNFKALLTTKSSKTDDLKTDTSKVLSDNNHKAVDKISTTVQETKIVQNPFIISKTRKIQNGDDDDEFLQKLSPSLKNRNMLSYFNKVEKQFEIDMFSNELDNKSNSDEETIIKVKFGTKRQKKSKKKRGVLDDVNIRTQNALVQDSVIDLTSPQIINKTIKDDLQTITKDNKGKNKEGAENIQNSNRKRKRTNIKIFKSDTLVNKALSATNSTDCTRPKRNIKKPVKYVDEVVLSSSDDETIFSIKKKKVIETKQKNVEDNKEKKPDSLKNANKLAPIFANKFQTSTISNEAKKKFLQSGVPKEIKKMIKKQLSASLQSNHFFATKHIQQNIASDTKIDFSVEFNLKNDNDTSVQLGFDGYNQLLSFCTNTTNKNINVMKCDIAASLKTIKNFNPNFPVYRTYRLLLNKCTEDYKQITMVKDLDDSSQILNEVSIESREDLNYLTWTEKYRSTFAKDIIGNFNSIKEMKQWLQSWQENAIKKNDQSDSDSSDFYYDSDTNSRDGMKTTNNLLIVTGPVGSGKTSSVYAVAAELSMKVIEVNASSRRTGKIILQDLQEATQSHKVNRTNVKGLESSQNVGKKRKKKNKQINEDKCKQKAFFKTESDSQCLTSSQESAATQMSLILIDDADIIFDQDDGFTPALTQIIQCSKRPVILVATSLTCQHLQKFLLCQNIVKMHRFQPHILGTWLDIMGLAETGLCWPGLGRTCLNYCKGDIRKAVNYFQFLMSSEANNNKQNDSQESAVSTDSKISIDVEDESSSLSWIDNDVHKKINDPNIFQSDSFKHMNMYFTTNLNYLTLWWNIPKLLFQPQSCQDSESVADSGCDVKHITLDAIANALDSFSIHDLICSRREPERYINYGPWYLNKSESVSECENFDNFDNCHEVLNDISQELISKSLLPVQPDFEDNIDVCLPDASTKW